MYDLHEEIAVDQKKFEDQFKFVADGNEIIHASNVTSIVLMIFCGILFIVLLVFYCKNFKNEPDEYEEVIKMAMQ